MNPSLRPTSSNGGISARNSKLNIFLWNFMRTLTMCSMLLMVLSIYYSFIASEDGNRGGVLLTIIVVFGLISYTLIIPSLSQIAAVAIPYVKANKHLSIRLLKSAVFIFGKYNYPFLVYFQTSSLMTGVGLLKLYGDGGPGCIRVMFVIAFDAMWHCVYTFGSQKEIHGFGCAECGAGWALLGLSIMGVIAYVGLSSSINGARERVKVGWELGTDKFLGAFGDRQGDHHVQKSVGACWWFFWEQY